MVKAFWLAHLVLAQLKMVGSQNNYLLTAWPRGEARFLIYPQFIFCCCIGDLKQTSARPDIESRNL